MNVSSDSLRIALLATLAAAPVAGGLGDSFEVRTLSVAYRSGTVLTGQARSTEDAAWTVAASTIGATN